MANDKTPGRVNDAVRPKFGMPAILAQSDRVVEAFGPQRGFALMVLAILAGSSVVAAAIILLAKVVGRFLPI
jgi:hypothetical protein